jgi:hypothetical protein
MSGRPGGRMTLHCQTESDDDQLRTTHNGHLEFLKPYIQVYPVVQAYSRMFRLNSSYIAHCASSPMWMLTGSFGRPASAWLSRVINSVSEAT